MADEQDKDEHARAPDKSGDGDAPPPSHVGEGENSPFLPPPPADPKDPSLPPINPYSDMVAARTPASLPAGKPPSAPAKKPPEPDPEPEPDELLQPPELHAPPVPGPPPRLAGTTSKQGDPIWNTSGGGGFDVGAQGAPGGGGGGEGDAQALAGIQKTLDELLVVAKDILAKMDDDNGAEWGNPQ